MRNITNEAIKNRKGAVGKLLVQAQTMSKKGYLGPEIKFTIWAIEDVSKVLVEKLAELPEMIEDVKLDDWTSVQIIVTRVQ